MTQLTKNRVLLCEQDSRQTRIDNLFTRPPLQNPSEDIKGPEDAMKNEFVPELPGFGGYENIVTAMDVFSRYFFAYPTSSQHARAVARVLINIITKHAFFPPTIDSVKGIVFLSQFVKKKLELSELRCRLPEQKMQTQLHYVNQHMSHSKRH